MKLTLSLCLALSILMLTWASLTFGAVPQSINYQGRLTNAVGAPVNDTVSLVFTICSDSLCAKTLWTETQNDIIITDGIFAVRLGSINPITPDAFGGGTRWLSISLHGQTVNRRLPLVSVPYAYQSVTADTADYARNAGASDCAGCNEIFVNTIGPDSVYASSGTAFLAKTEASAGDYAYGVRGIASNSSGGTAFGGAFSSLNIGTGVHYGVYGEALGVAAGQAYGVSGVATNSSSGETYGGRFWTLAGGTGSHTGVRSEAFAASAAPTWGVSSWARNTSSGLTYGGRFEVDAAGSGAHYGVYSTSAGSTDVTTYGIYGSAENSSTGDAYSGYFLTSINGTGRHFGVDANAYCNSESEAYGVNGMAQNNSTGDAYGGYFSTTAYGTGLHYGVKGIGRTGASPEVYGVVGEGSNTSSGAAFGGIFATDTLGTGHHTGIYARADGSSESTMSGVVGIAMNSSTGISYGGRFLTFGDSPGQKIGVYASCPTASEPGINFAGFFDGPVIVMNNFQVMGTKSAVVGVGNQEYRSVYCQESPENWFEDFGEGRLVNGRAHIDLDPVYLQTVTIDANHPMKVFVQLEGDCRGVYVSKSTTGFDVNELQGGTSGVAFSYRVVAKRKGYEDLRLATTKVISPDVRQAMQNQGLTNVPKAISERPSQDE